MSDARTTLTQVRDKAITAVAARAMSMPIERQTPHLTLRTRVTAVTALSEHVRRVRLAAPEMGAGYTLAGPDEYVGLLMPQVGRDLPPIPPDAGTAVRSALRAIPEDVRPDLRWYTIRRLLPDTHEVDVDLVVHGDSGPGSAWALRVRPGEEVGMQTASACYRVPGASGHHLIVGDETSAPAIAAILETVEDDVTAHVVLEVPDRSYLPEVGLLEGRGALVVERGTRPNGEAALEATVALDLPELSFGWACGEKRLSSSLRRHLVRERGLDRRSVYFCAYWNEGKARH